MKLRRLEENLSGTKKKLETEVNLDDFEQFLKDNYSPESYAFLKAQLTYLNKPPKGCRYSDNYKQFALSVYFLGPKAYKKLATVCRLPSKSTLQRCTQNWVINPGFNDFIFRLLELRVSLMQDKAKDCILCIDEISLKCNLYYNISKDKITGFQEGFMIKSADIAGNALIIMARGIVNSWK